MKYTITTTTTTITLSLSHIYIYTKLTHFSGFPSSGALDLVCINTFQVNWMKNRPTGTRSVENSSLP